MFPLVSISISSKEDSVAWNINSYTSKEKQYIKSNIQRAANIREKANV